jgi:hypothetical protein
VTERVLSERAQPRHARAAAAGRVVGSWVYRDRRIVVERLEPLGAADERSLETERAALEAFHA